MVTLWLLPPIAHSIYPEIQSKYFLSNTPAGLLCDIQTWMFFVLDRGYFQDCS